MISKSKCYSRYATKILYTIDNATVKPMEKTRIERKKIRYILNNTREDTGPSSRGNSLKKNYENIKHMTYLRNTCEWNGKNGQGKK